MSPLHRRGPVFYASLPCDSDGSSAHQADREKARCRLVAILWEHLVTMEGRLRGGDLLSSHKASLPVHLIRDPLGKPHLMLGKHPGPAVSFSQGGGAVWAALCEDESGIGIDVAGSDEFAAQYPVSRVFAPQEVQQAMHWAGGDMGRAAALLWSVKEAAVKAMGCGFHLVEPRDICIQPGVVRGGECIFAVGLSDKGLERLPMAAGRAIWVYSVPLARMWLSVAS